jgi:AbrB family looped-hinge helix DNA binding protein
MTTVTLSTKYQVVIPAGIRQRLGLRPGKKYQVVSYGDCIEFIPVRKVQEMRGVLKGIETTIEREKDRL